MHVAHGCVAVRGAQAVNDSCATIEQVRAVSEVLVTSPLPLRADDITARFTSRGAWKKRIGPLLDMLVALGRASEKDGLYRARG